MPSFALITEGITDQIVIENILYGFVGDLEIDINPLQPLRDETDENRASNFGNWHKVLEYCSSDRFKNALQFNDFIVVQIDTDAKSGKTKGCLDTLNRALVKQKSFSIDSQNKRPDYYRIVSEPYAKHKKLMALHKYNPSLNTFVRSLEESVPLAQ